MRMPTLETDRLVIRPFTIDDLDAIHQILDLDLRMGAQSREERASWLRWTVMGYDEFARLYQPPYGDRAVVLKGADRLIGACGFVPCLMPFGQLPSLRAGAESPADRLNTCEFGLFYAFSSAYHRQGYATEATRAMIAYAFEELNLRRIVATTTYDNAGSMGVMRRVGMRIEKNPRPDPPWLQVVGILEAEAV